MSDRQPVASDQVPQVWLGLTQTAEQVTGWTSVAITRAIDSCADAYRLTMDWDPAGESRRRFVPFSSAAVRLSVDNEVVITGYIERLTPEVSGDSRTLTIEGRSTTGVLLDWSAGGPGRGYEFRNVTLGTVARELARPNQVIAMPDTPLIPVVEFEPGQTVYEVLSAIAAGHALFAAPQPNGSLRFTRFSGAGAPTKALDESESPIRRISATYDTTKRFQEYVVFGQTDSVPDVSAGVRDPQALGVSVRARRVRRLVQQTQDVQEAAVFERNRALIDSFCVRATVTGWTYRGQLWQPGEIVSVRAPSAMLYNASNLIVNRVTLRSDPEFGQETDLELSLPAAYSNAKTIRGALPWQV